MTAAPLGEGCRVEVVCVGETMVLVSPWPPQPLHLGATLRLGVAGAESNVAVHLARLAVRAAWVSRVGDDPLGRIVLGALEAEGVDVSGVETTADAPTGIFLKNPQDSGTSVHYYRKGSAASGLDRGVWDRVDGTRVALVHLSGVTPALSASCADLVRHALRSRPWPQAQVSFDVNYRPALWSVEEAAPILAELANLADVVLVGRDEAATLWGTATPADVRDRLPAPRRLVVKDGGVGATSFVRSRATFVAAPAVAVAEPVGAGDAFAAGYLFGQLRHLPEDVRLAVGHRLAGGVLRSSDDLGEPVGIDDLVDDRHTEGSSE